MDIFEIKKNNNFLSEDNIKFINETVLSNQFPWFSEFTITGSNDLDYFFLAHTVQRRLEEYPINEIINSPNYYHPTINILNNFLKSINEKCNFFLRIAYNLTFNNGNDKSQIHKDHEYKHKQVIIYLNDADPESKTCIVDKKGNIIKEITPKKFEGICFNDIEHFAYFPKKGLRAALIATYI